VGFAAKEPLFLLAVASCEMGSLGLWLGAVFQLGDARVSIRPASSPQIGIFLCTRDASLEILRLSALFLLRVLIVEVPCWIHGNSGGTEH
jgi:hypothetical protein